MRLTPFSHLISRNPQENGEASDARCNLPFPIISGLGGLLALAAGPTGIGVAVDLDVLATAMLMVALGITIFWQHGRHQITAAGLYGLTAALMVGFAGIWWIYQPGQIPPAVRIGTLTGFWSTWAMYALWWRKPRVNRSLGVVDPVTVNWGLSAGVAVATLGVAVALLRLPGGVHFSFAGMALLMCSLVLGARGRAGTVGRLALAGGVVLVYTNTVFTGYGRLNLAALGLVALVLTSAMSRGRVLKAGVLAAMPVALVILIRMREQLGFATKGREFDGMGSVVNPLRTFGDLVAAHDRGAYAHGMGDSFFATFLFWVPRSLWEDKPPGFGSLLTSILEPQLLARGHSMAAHAYGEWYYNFGWFGMIPMLIVVGGFVKLLDIFLWKSLSMPVVSRRQLVALVCSILLVCDVLTLMWAGSFTYVARATQQITFLVVTAGVFASKVRMHAREGPKPALSVSRE